MATERVYSPDTCEPFDVTPSKATVLVLEKGWTRTPWTRVPVAEPAPAPVVDQVEDEVEPEAEVEPARGRGRRRRTAVVAPEADEDEGAPSEDVDAGESWRS
jgi:hypothetical protein